MAELPTTDEINTDAKQEKIDDKFSTHVAGGRLFCQDCGTYVSEAFAHEHGSVIIWPGDN